MARLRGRKVLVLGAGFVGVVVAIAAAVVNNNQLALVAIAALVGLGVALAFFALDAARSSERRIDALERALTGEQGLKGEIRSLTTHVTSSKEQLRRDLTRELRDQTTQFESLLQVLPRLGGLPLLPPSGGFALDARALAELSDHLLGTKPQLVLELGSGTSTVWIAHHLKQTGGRIVSCDHDPYYANATRLHLERHSLADIAEVRDAPLVARGEETPWYDKSALADLEDIDLLLVDGPPAATGPFARRPALEVLRHSLRPGATVILDDTHREDEQAILREWLERWPEFRRIDAGVSRMAVLQDVGAR